MFFMFFLQQMERFKVVERETKTKAYSKEWVHHSYLINTVIPDLHRGGGRNKYLEATGTVRARRTHFKDVTKTN